MPAAIDANWRNYTELADAILPIIERERAAERAKIVAEIRDQDGHGEWQEVADAVEAGGTGDD